MGGRIEEAFANAKSKGEAAFVTFVTAGYPTADGELKKTIGNYELVYVCVSEGVTNKLSVVFTSFGYDAWWRFAIIITNSDQKNLLE